MHEVCACMTRLSRKSKNDYDREDKYRCHVALVPWDLHAELDFVPVDRDASGVHKTICTAYVTILQGC